MASIYKLTGDFAQLQQLVESGEIDETQAADTFDAIKADLETKAVNSGYVVKNLEADVEARAEAIKQLSERNKKLKRQSVQSSNVLCMQWKQPILRRSTIRLCQYGLKIIQKRQM
ncbi:hypothetical protein LASAK_00457 [Latilactobacillus sakei]|nr:hypothetical protein LASAK_00457 [Latilactobacillus sakei]